MDKEKTRDWQPPELEPEVFARKGGGYAGGLGRDLVDGKATPPPSDQEERDRSAD